MVNKSGGKKANREGDELEKLTVIINGAGGVGKDTLCGIAGEFYRVKTVSSIDPILKIARHGGWTGEKSPAGRRLLSDLKAAFSRYNNLSTRYLLDEYETFLAGDDEIMFVHIREAEEIDRFRAGLRTRNIALLVTASRIAEGSFGNVSDDHVKDYDYDFVYHNDCTPDELVKDFMRFFRGIADGTNVTDDRPKVTDYL